MQNFTYYAPTEVIFGKDSENQLPEKIKAFGGSRVFLVYGGGSVVKSGLLPKIEDSLQKAGLSFQRFGGAQPNPLLSHARTGVKEAISFGADFILAVGGGSAIDTAKGIAHGTANPNTDIWDFWIGEKPLVKSLPVGVVLTISAAGSEMSCSAVLTDDQDTGLKRGLNTDFNRPKFAVMNPELTYTLPKFQIACGVVDIMMHTMDRYFNPVTTNELTDEIAEGLLRVVVKNGPIALKNPKDYQAMSELMWAGSLSHNSLTGLGGVNDFSTHALGQELSAQFNTAHGATLSAMWGSLASYIYPTNPARFAQFGEKVWGIKAETPEQGAKAAIEATVQFFRSVEMPTCFTEAGIPVQTDDALKKMAQRVTYYGKRPLVGSFHKLNETDIYEIFKLANH